MERAENRNVKEKTEDGHKARRVVKEQMCSRVDTADYRSVLWKTGPGTNWNREQKHRTGD